MKNQQQTEALKKIIIKTFNAPDPIDPKKLAAFYDADAVFQDPVTQVQGLAEIESYYKKAFKNVKSIHFDFKDILTDGETFNAPWTMTLAVHGLNAGKPYQVEGTSVIKFNAKKKVIYHRDYLDLSQMVYERIPVLGKAITLAKSFLA